jgi:hypothetical protein
MKQTISMRFTKVFVAILLLIAVFYLATIKSSEEFRYSCSGFYKIGDYPYKGEVFLKISKYRWWAYIWNGLESDGDVLTEVYRESAKKPFTFRFDYIKFLDERLDIYNDEKKLVGTLSFLSKKLSSDIIPDFQGKCSQL